MIRKPLRPLGSEGIRMLMDVSRRLQPATTWIKDARVLNVYTGEVLRQQVSLYNDRIAYVGEKEPLIDENTLIIEAEPYVLVPGYIEPHSHPFQFYNVKTLGEYALTRGTTSIMMDTMVFHNTLKLEHVLKIMDYSMQLPVKNFWWAKLDPQSRNPELIKRYTVDNIRAIMEHPRTIQAGELTDWVPLLEGDDVQVEGMRLAKEYGLRVEGHHPGASTETLNAVTAAGVTACHEAMTGEEVVRRLRLGLYAHLRHSSIRPDVPKLVSDLLKEDIRSWERIMFTTDGSTPPFLEHGVTDYLLKLAMDEGLDPAVAYRLATLNPAVYYGLDDEIGGIAPGRIADILFLRDLKDPTPVKVMVNGEIHSEEGKLVHPFPEADWESWGLSSIDGSWHADAGWFQIKAEAEEEGFPVIRMLNAVITKCNNEILPVSNGNIDIKDKEFYQYVAAIDRSGKRVSSGVVRGFARTIGAIASTYTASGDILVIGDHPEEMAQAVNQAIKIGGGIVMVENGEVLYALSLPLGGFMTDYPMNQVIRESKQLVALLRERGHKHIDPIYSLLFMTAFHLPAVRLAAEGVMDVKTGEIIFPAKELTPL
ncbi:adenine deaminase C-terminal domain-containing protein [Aneurinibacillus sp. Ricciae_BoGa-3]|uniref:adenine deaminase C-terminal domain-containing protein n=1 Tax=Aneurinibacillus sp. Ricciae_BoGa-3 TaxID=3022697 RepID=UPI0023400DE0|nr:adenine deaminase C-terminal domain-containing protein [Aneurinibacillus sp. Ricciae_BoGa-3]WCK55028.1 adenine deaminase C-terminal domain-containing protein [Aneurinibacillus sp. Ricciae_BoGa-3]